MLAGRRGKSVERVERGTMRDLWHCTVRSLPKGSSVASPPNYWSNEKRLLGAEDSQGFLSWEISPAPFIPITLLHAGATTKGTNA